MIQKYYRATSETYEAIRSAMDGASGYPSTISETWFVPATDAPTDSEGNCLIAAIAPIADQFAIIGAEELTAEEFAALLSQSEAEEI
jgi:hypothetical protein